MLYFLEETNNIDLIKDQTEDQTCLSTCLDQCLVILQFDALEMSVVSLEGS